MLNFTGTLAAPNLEAPPVFVATYTDGFNFKRKEIHAPTRCAAYAIAVGRPPLGCTLTNLRKKKAPRPQAEPTRDDQVDVKLTRALYGIHANTDAACRMALDEIHDMVRRARS